MNLKKANKIDNEIYWNENNALIKINEGKFDEAEELLSRNADKNTSSARTYQLLINIYKKNNDYKKLIRTINKAIEFSSGNKKDFKELKKVTVLNKILKDIFK